MIPLHYMRSCHRIMVHGRNASWTTIWLDHFGIESDHLLPTQEKCGLDRSGVLLELLFASFSLCVAVLQEGMHLRLVLAWLSDSNV